jgi:Mn2+/Fe2+ NRAMP family transporter
MLLKAARFGTIASLLALPIAVMFLCAGDSAGLLLKISPIFWGLWAVFAVWIILNSGLAHPVEKECEENSGVPSSVWIMLGLANLVAALAALTKDSLG